MLHYICDIFDWSRSFRVVCHISCNFFLNFYLNINTNNLKQNLILMIHNFRFPDLLIRLEKYNGLPKTLCEVVQPSSVTNETTHMYGCLFLVRFSLYVSYNNFFPQM